MNNFFADYPVTGGNGVTSLNGLTGALTLIGAGGITITPAGSNITITGSGGTVTSVGLADGSTVPLYAISGSPVTTSGTLTFTLMNQSANTVFAGPTTEAPAQPTFRSLVAADIPDLSGIYANIELSNLGSTAINASLITGPTDGSVVLGSATNFFGNSFISKLLDSSSVTSVDPFNRILRNSSNIITVDWGNGALNDNTGNQQLEWAVNGVSIFTKLNLDGATSGSFTQKAFATTTTYTVTWPAAQGAASTFLQNDGAGNLSWLPASGGSSNATNLIVNSAFDYWQVGTSTVVTASGGSTPTPVYAYQADQWYVNNILGGGTTEGQITYSQATGSVLGSKFGANIAITTAPSGTGSQNGTELYTTLSNGSSLALYGQTASFSVQIKALNNVTSVGVQFYYATTEVKVNTPIGSEVVTTVTNSGFTACTINGQALGTLQSAAGVVGVRIRIVGVSSGNTFDVGNGFVAEQAMLNLGATAAPFSRQGPNPETEIAACKYFYTKSYDLTTAPGTATTNGLINLNTFSSPVLTVAFNTCMRTASGVGQVYSSATGAAGTVQDYSMGSDLPASTVNYGTQGMTIAVSGGTPGMNIGYHWTYDARI